MELSVLRQSLVGHSAVEKQIDFTPLEFLVPGIEGSAPALRCGAWETEALDLTAARKKDDLGLQNGPLCALQAPVFTLNVLKREVGLSPRSREDCGA